MIENLKKSKGLGRFPGPFSHLRCTFRASHAPMTCMDILGQYLGGKGVCTQGKVGVWKVSGCFGTVVQQAGFPNSRGDNLAPPAGFLALFSPGHRKSVYFLNNQINLG